MLAWIARLTHPEAKYLRAVKRAAASGPLIEDTGKITQRETGLVYTSTEDHIFTECLHLILTPRPEQIELAKSIMGNFQKDHMLDFDKLPPYETRFDFEGFQAQTENRKHFNARYDAIYEINSTFGELQSKWRLPWKEYGQKIYSEETGSFRLSAPPAYDVAFYKEFSLEMQKMLCLRNPLKPTQYRKKVLASELVAAA